MKLLGKALNHLGSMLVTNVPIGTGGHVRGPENDVASWDQLFEVQEDENSREHQFYHQFLDHNSEISDQEDMFQKYGKWTRLSVTNFVADKSSCM